MSTQKRKRQAISIETKKEILDEASKGKSLGDLAEKFGISSRSTVQGILENKDKILDAIENGIGGKRARLKPAKYEDLEAAVLMWLKQVRAQNVVVDGPTLKVNYKPIF